jgi:fructose-specific phosphotransferase system IIC component
MDQLRQLRQHLLTGVSYAIPFVACGGILIALSLACAPKIEGMALDKSLQLLEPVWWRNFLLTTLTIGGTAFGLMLPILGGYISYSIAGKPGLVAGMIGGFLCGHLRVPWADPATVPEVSAGFLGALVAGLIAGYIVQGIKAVPTHKLVKPIMPILIIPVVSSVIVGALMLLVVGPWIAEVMDSLKQWLEHMQTGNKIVLAAVLGAMIAFDMGGPVNKAAFFFASGLIAQHNIYVMGPVAAAICTPPLGMGLATVIGRRLWTDEQRESGYAALGMGLIGITEGAIPFAAADPLGVIPCIMLGSMCASVTAMLNHVGDNAPHGGPIVTFVVDNKGMYLVSIVVGTVVTALAINTLKALGKKGEPAAA